jgi:hypothetical protein
MMIVSRKTYLRLLFPCVMPGMRRIWAEATRDAGAPIGFQPRVVWSTPCGTPGTRSTRDNRTACGTPAAGSRPERTSEKTIGRYMFHQKNYEV